MLPFRREAVGVRSLVGSLAVLLGGLAAAAPVDVDVRDHLVAVHARDASLRTVLEAVADSCNLEIRSSTAMRQLVTVDTAPRPLPHLLRSLLRDYSYVLQYGDGGGKSQRLWILAPAGDGNAHSAWAAGHYDQSLDEIVLDLANPNPEVRIEAVLALGDLGSEEIGPFLSQSLADESGAVREAARAVLEDTGMAQAGSRSAAEN